MQLRRITLVFIKNALCRLAMICTSLLTRKIFFTSDFFVAIKEIMTTILAMSSFPASQSYRPVPILTNISISLLGSTITYETIDYLYIQPQRLSAVKAFIFTQQGCVMATIVLHFLSDRCVQILGIMESGVASGSGERAISMSCVMPHPIYLLLLNKYV